MQILSKLHVMRKHRRAGLAKIPSAIFSEFFFVPSRVAYPPELAHEYFFPLSSPVDLQPRILPSLNGNRIKRHYSGVVRIKTRRKEDSLDYTAANLSRLNYSLVLINHCIFLHRIFILQV